MDGGRIFRDLIVLITGKKKLSIGAGSFVSILCSLILGVISILHSYWVMLVLMMFACVINAILWYGEVKDIK